MLLEMDISFPSSSLEKDFGLGHYVYKRDWKKKPGDPGMWPQSKKTEAVLTWLTCGNLTTTASLIGVGHNTVKAWRKQPWWQEQVDDFRDNDKVELDARYQKIIRKALDVVDDRLENGNFQMDQKTGKIVRVPVSISDGHKVMTDLVSQQQTLRKDKQQEQKALESMNDKLLKLATSFAEMAMKQKPQKDANIYDMVEDIPALENQDALHEGRPT